VGLEPTFCFSAMYRQNTELLKLLEPVVSSMGYELLGIEYLGAGRNSVLRIYIDSASGITIKDCACVSEQVTGILDINDPIKGTYHLEISSPGFDRPLFTLDHFKRHIGKYVRLQLHNKIAGRRRIAGVINRVNAGSVEIMVDDIRYDISADDIDKARLVTE
jgi:ribosome maturation factor RimP